jgi:hypothetical protein
MKPFNKVYPYGPDAYVYWYSGIYKIVSYGKGSYHAYFIQEWFDNWGDHVSAPPDLDNQNHPCWRTLNAAKAACREHASNYTPSDTIVKRAAEIVADTIEEAKQYAVAA